MSVGGVLSKLVSAIVFAKDVWDAFRAKEPLPPKVPAKRLSNWRATPKPPTKGVQ